MRAFRWAPLLMFTCLTPASTATAEAPRIIGLVDRVVAVVHDDVILLSELRTRAKPFDKVIEAQTKPGPERAAVDAQMRRELLEKLIEEQLIEREARRLHLTTTPEEVDAAVGEVAKSQSMSVHQLFFVARGAGLDEADYRHEIRRQIVERKVLTLQVVPRIRGYFKLSVAAQAERLAEARATWMTQLKKAVFIEVRL